MIRDLNELKTLYPEISKQVYDAVPVSKRERRGCVTEKMENDYARIKMAKKLIEQAKEKREYKDKSVTINDPEVKVKVMGEVPKTNYSIDTKNNRHPFP